MLTGLVVERNGSADEVPLTFSATKFTAFKQDAAAFKFNAEVSCPQGELNQRAEALGNFIEQVHRRGAAKPLI